MIKLCARGMQLVNITSWLISNIYIVSGTCRWFDGFVIVNGGSQEAAVHYAVRCASSSSSSCMSWSLR